ncbi:MAG: hypothetical protein AUJ24_01135 [Parcubacteria group bacterium CG1_02_36_42]|uniref:Uncharacterized protein n=1 Tax=Candidatus Nealsonbacteria bacterium CG_4_9_14_0_8_um_filter_35_12 TaxID=1974692 RepID=A0A2M8DNQ4_9BACT|nr:MAG: hypothetical protein AUJ24_01135 [Parcubacteria group bacterium CG1_02_36_42]PJB99748.1 MAG: hypothetical protein CO077_00165 [Candidatus Nealsonbacteria bacterium CG_4_9_14_0_8_um_filter_35_12]
MEWGIKKYEWGIVENFGITMVFCGKPFYEIRKDTNIRKLFRTFAPIAELRGSPEVNFVLLPGRKNFVIS